MPIRLVYLGKEPFASTYTISLAGRFWSKENGAKKERLMTLPVPLIVLDMVKDLSQAKSAVKQYIFNHFGILGQDFVLIYVDQRDRVAIFKVTGGCNVR